jgi:Lon protease-like protein
MPLEDGRYNIVVRGDVRFRIVEEVSRVPYRTARVILEPDLSPGVTEAYAQREWLADVSRQYLQYLPDQSDVPEIETVSLDALTNALIMSLNLDMEEKQKLLELRDTLARAQQIGTELTSRMESLQFLKPYRRDGDPSRN